MQDYNITVQQVQNLRDVCKSHGKIIDFHETRRMLDEDAISNIRGMIYDIIPESKKLKETLDFSNKRGMRNDTALSSLKNSFEQQNQDLKAENEKLWKWFSAAKAGIAKQSEFRKSEVQKLEKTVEQLAAQVHELKLATSRRCKNCGTDFTPLRVHHEKCKPCTITKSTITCNKCKKPFVQSHYTHKYCSTCYK